ncbi:Uncharacterised protein [Vibrio cholerae]|nr:Uncharacterised protein [Vibrio cholerae]
MPELTSLTRFFLQLIPLAKAAKRELTKGKEN